MTGAAPSEIAVREPGERLGFFTDTTVCIGCKACEVACKQWNDLPADGHEFRKGGSYDHTGSLGPATWRHVRFVERLEPSPEMRADAEAALGALEDAEASLRLARHVLAEIAAALEAPADGPTASHAA